MDKIIGSRIIVKVISLEQFFRLAKPKRSTYNIKP